MRTRILAASVMLGGLLGAFAGAAHAQSNTVRITNGPTIDYADQKSATISWSTSAPSNSRVWYGEDKNNLTHQAEAPYGGTTHKVEIKDLHANTTYYFQVESEEQRRKAEGPEAESRGVLAFKTVAAGQQPVRNERPTVAEGGLANPENGKVKITRGPSADKVTGTTAAIEWSTNLKGSTRVMYGTDAANLTQMAEAPWGAGGLNHSVELKDLKPNTTYYYQVETGQAAGTGGAAVDSNVQSFKTGGGVTQASQRAKQPTKKK